MCGLNLPFSSFCVQARLSAKFFALEKLTFCLAWLFFSVPFCFADTSSPDLQQEHPQTQDKTPLKVLDGKTLFQLGTGDNLCVITFDDGPGQYTPKLLQILEEQKVPATFFLVGRQIKQFPNIVRMIKEKGQIIGNHTLSHNPLRHRATALQQQEIVSVQKMLHDLDVNAQYLRPPYGCYDKETLRIMLEQGMKLILWSIDSMDWRSALRIENLRTQVEGQKLRGIFLFHDTHKPTVDAMPEILNYLRNDGCHFVSLPDFMDQICLAKPRILPKTTEIKQTVKEEIQTETKPEEIKTEIKPEIKIKNQMDIGVVKTGM